MIPGSIPGLEDAAIQGTPGAITETTRSSYGRRLASRLVGLPVDLVRVQDGWELVERSNGAPLVQQGAQLHQVDPATGEVLGPVCSARVGSYAALLLRGAAPENHVAGTLCHKEKDGQTSNFLGGMALWKSSLRLDPNWMTVMRTRSRNKARERLKAMEAQLPRQEKILRVKRRRDGKLSSDRLFDTLLTLTQPHKADAKTIDQVRTFNLAFRALTKTDLWKQTVYGGIKGVEDKLDADGPHVHGHLLLFSRWIDRPAWVAAWTAALDSAHVALYGVGLDSGVQAVIDVRLVRKKMKPSRERPGECSLDTALNEVSKYITKTSDLLNADSHGRFIPAEVLIDQCDVTRWPRMFELMGACRCERSEHGTSVHTSCISDAEALRDLLTQARDTTEGPAPEPSPMKQQWEREYSYRRETQQDGSVIMIREEPGEREPIEWQYHRGRGEYEAKQRARPATWRELIPQLSFADWLHLMMGRAERGAIFRLKWIAENNSTCFLVDLTGKCRVKQQPEIFEGEN